jgi:hypothetical protein
MSLQIINNKLDVLKFKIATLTTELNNIDYAVNNTENPDDAQILVGLFDKKVAEFVQLQDQFEVLLNEFNEETRKASGTVSFSAHKLLKSIKA